MWSAKERIRPVLIAAVLLLMLQKPPVYAAEIAPEEEIEDSRTEYRTAEIVRGDMEILNEFRFADFIWQEEEIRYHGPDAVCTEVHKSYRMSVEEGESILTLRLNLSEIDIQEAERALQRKQEAYQLKCASYDDEIAALRRQAGEAADALSRDLLTLEIQKKTIEYQRFRYETEREIEADAKKCASLREETIISAPAAGTIIFLTGAKNGKEVIHDGDVLARVRHADRVVVAADESSDTHPAKAHIGTRVRFTMKDADQEEKTIEGTVFASNLVREMSYAASMESWSLIRLDVSDPEEIREILDNEKPINVFHQMLYVERDIRNILKIPAKALSNGTDFVTICGADQTVNQRPVLVSQEHSEEEYWLIDGAGEGESVVTRERSY